MRIKFYLKCIINEWLPDVSAHGLKSGGQRHGIISANKINSLANKFPENQAARALLLW